MRTNQFPFLVSAKASDEAPFRLDVGAGPGEVPAQTDTTVRRESRPPLLPQSLGFPFRCRLKKLRIEVLGVAMRHDGHRLVTAVRQRSQVFGLIRVTFVRMSNYSKHISVYK